MVDKDAESSDGRGRGGPYVEAAPDAASETLAYLDCILAPAFESHSVTIGSRRKLPTSKAPRLSRIAQLSCCCQCRHSVDPLLREA
jgi:hypothetical protein